MSKRLIIEVDVPERAQLEKIFNVEMHQSNGRFYTIVYFDDFFSERKKLGDGLSVRVVEAPEPTAQDVIDELEEWAALSTDAF